LDITVLREALEDLADVAQQHRTTISQDIGAGPKQGRPRGAKHFPQLRPLVFGLEFGARLAAGGFTLDRNLAKGTLLNALDLMKQLIMAEAEWIWIAEFMPSPSQHPVATYQRIIAEARRYARATLIHTRESHWRKTRH
jgi:hypothetical protein